MQALLRAVGQRRFRRQAGLAALRLFTVLLLLLLLGLPASRSQSAWIRRAYLALSAAVGVAAVLVTARTLRRPGELEIAREVEAAVPRARLGDRLRSSLELAAAPAGPHAPSAALVALHVADSARAAAKLDPRRLVGFGVLRDEGKLPAFLALSLLLAVLIAPRSLPRFLSWVAGDGPGAAAGAALLVSPAASQAPVLAAIELTVRPPAYTGLPERVIPGSTGDVTVLRGSEIEIRARTDVPVASARLLLEPGGPVPFTVAGGRDLAVRLIAREDAAWSAELSRDGDAAVDPVRHAIAVEADRVPEVTLGEPAADLEVDELQPIALGWTARDDFAVAAVELVVRRGRSETREKLTGDSSSTPGERSGRSIWRPRGAPLEPGEELRLTIEALDNDTVSGPKRGVSRTLTVKVRDAGSVHGETIAAMARLLDETAATLATTLTAPTPGAGNAPVVAAVEREIGGRIEGHVSALDDLLRRLWKDPLGSEKTYQRLADLRLRLDAISREKSSLLNRQAMAILRPIADAALVRDLVGLRDRETHELEGGALLLDELVHHERAGEVKLLADSILRDQKRLDELLEQFRKTGDAGLKAEMERLMDRIEAKFAEMNAKVAAMGRQAAEEFVNLDALRRQLGPSGMSSLEAMRKALARGDTSELERRARELQQALSRTMSALGSAGRGGGRLADARSDPEMAAALERLRELQGAQARVVDSTDGLKRELSNRRFGKDPGRSFAEASERARAVAAAGRKALAELDRAPGLADRLADQRRLEELTREVNRRLLMSDDLQAMESFRAELFSLRAKLADPRLQEQLEARRSLEDGVRLGERTAEALGGRALGEALKSARPMRGLFADASERLGGDGHEADGASDAPEGKAGGTTGVGEAAGRASRSAADAGADLVADLEALERLTRRPLGEEASEGDGARLSDLSRRQRTLRRETGEIGDLLEGSAGKDQLPEGLGGAMAEAGDYMDQAARGMEARAVDDGLSNARAAAERLDSALRSLERSQGGGGKGDGKGDGQGAAARVFSFVPEGAEGEPRFRDRNGQQGERGQSGERGASAEKVAIPGAGESAAPEAFRRDVLEGMKQPRPAGYEDVLDRYYRRLVR